ncbi:MAG: hypothetical protein FJZ47_04495 [Candidatus Tectomicrobia bacterium]|uniref:Uncharacterized protein n=1 Tax=Tectimicrobiota bacterium TaxID=2528274 RepID=A0A938B2Q9_UNCTE|nr:hypothetical protein [Candidatus Tectomicrobia bacterium]
METVIIIRDGRRDATELIARLGTDVRIEKLPDGRFFVEDAPYHLWLGHDDAILNEYAEEELRTVREGVTAPVPFVCEFSDMAFGKRILGRILCGESCLVDNDHGNIVTGKEFVERLQYEPGWDWRLQT